MSKKTERQQANGIEQKNATVGALKLREARAYLGGLSVPTIHRL